MQTRRRLGLLHCLLGLLVCTGPLGLYISLDTVVNDLHGGHSREIGGTTIVPSDGIINFTVIDIRGQSLSVAERYLLASIDGLVNKNGTNLYIIASHIDEFWLDYFNRSGMYVGKEQAFTGVLDLVDQYEPYFSGILVFDEGDPDQSNMATPLCGASRSLLVDKDMYASVKARFDAPVTYNMSHIVLANALVDRTAKYGYAFQHFYPLSNGSALAYYDETAPHHARSFYIANNIFTLWRVNYVQSAPDTGSKPPDAPGELALVGRVLDETPINIPIYGYFYPDGGNEGVATAELSRRGKYIIANDWAFNLPFFAQMHLPPGYSLNQSNPSNSVQAPALENKVYVAGLWSDGDNIQYVYNFMKFALWDNRQPGIIPTGWTISASCFRLMPWIMKWFYENATAADYFVAALSGKGYMYPGEMTDQMLQAYYSDVRTLLDSTDLHELHTMNIGQKADTVVSLLGDKVTAIFDGYGGSSYEYPDKVGGIPVMHSLYLTLLPNNTELQFQNVVGLKFTFPNQPVFVFFNVHCWSGDPTPGKGGDPLLWNKFASRLQAAGVEIVRPDVLAQLARQGIPDAHNVVQANIMAVIASVLVVGAVGVTFRKRRG